MLLTATGNTKGSAWAPQGSEVPYYRSRSLKSWDGLSRCVALGQPCYKPQTPQVPNPWDPVISQRCMLGCIAKLKSNFSKQLSLPKDNTPRCLNVWKCTTEKKKNEYALLWKDSSKMFYRFKKVYGSARKIIIETQQDFGRSYQIPKENSFAGERRVGNSSYLFS